ncbi:MAG: hypothetical protein HC831_00145 [Chloroflexia bacterium]|nr:hypothetical protein [Chloroflexia bacterium]
MVVDSDESRKGKEEETYQVILLILLDFLHLIQIMISTEIRFLTTYSFY